MFGRLWFTQFNEQADGQGSDLGGSATAGEEGSNQNADKSAGDQDKSKSDESDKSGKPSDSDAKWLKETMKWKERARDAETQISTLQQQVNGLSGLKDALGDLDVEAIKELAKQKKDAETLELERKGDYDRIVQQMKDENSREIQKYADQITTLNEQINGLQGQLNGRAQEIESMTVGRSFSESEFIREKSVLSPTVARTLFAGNFEYEDGQIVGYDKPNGQEGRTKLVDNTGKALSFDEALTRLYEKHPDSKTLIRSTVKPGAGSKTEESGSKGASTTALSGLDLIRQGLAKK